VDDGFDKVVAYFNDFWGGCEWYPSAVREQTYFVDVCGPFHPSDFDTISEECYALGWEIRSVAAALGKCGYLEFVLIPNELEFP
jgi:hypothetical protein